MEAIETDVLLLYLVGVESLPEAHRQDHVRVAGIGVVVEDVADPLLEVVRQAGADVGEQPVPFSVQP